MSTTVELRFEWPNRNGQATFCLTEQEALKAVVALRSLGLGLTFKRGQAMVSTQTTKFSAAETLLRKVR